MLQRSNDMDSGRSNQNGTDCAHSSFSTELIRQYEQLDTLQRSKIDRLYMAFLGTRSCIVSRRKPIQRHHVREFSNSGTGCKPPDIFCIPLHHDYHTGDKGIHTLGQSTFCQRYSIDFTAEIQKLHTKFEEYYRRLTYAK